MPYEAPMAEPAVPPHQHRRHFSRLGLGLAVYLVSNFVFSTAVYVLFAVLDQLGILSYSQAINGIPFWIMSYALPSGSSLLLFYLIVRRVPPKMPEERQPMPPLALGKIYCILTMIGFLLGYLTNFLMFIVANLRDAPVYNPVDDFSYLPLPVTIFLTCVVAPILEELTYRRLLIPRLRPYGDRFAIIASALCFGLMHGNLYQFLYAFATGIILGYVFLKTGCIWQTMLLHAVYNLVGGVLPDIVNQWGDVGNEFYLRLILCHIGLGAFFFLHRSRGIAYAPGVYPLETGQKWRYFLLNVGMICFCLLSVALSVWYLLG